MEPSDAVGIVEFVVQSQMSSIVYDSSACGSARMSNSQRELSFLLASKRNQLSEHLVLKDVIFYRPWVLLCANVLSCFRDTGDVNDCLGSPDRVAFWLSGW